MNAISFDEPSGTQLPLPFPPAEPLLSLKAAADAFQLSYSVVLQAVKNGDIPTYRFGNGRWRVRISDIEAVIQASRSSA